MMFVFCLICIIKSHIFNTFYPVLYARGRHFGLSAASPSSNRHTVWGFYEIGWFTFCWRNGLCTVSISLYCRLHGAKIYLWLFLAVQQKTQAGCSSLLLFIRGIHFNSMDIGHILLTAPLYHLLTDVVFAVFQARQVLEREFNNLLALGTDRRLEEVTLQAAALIKPNIVENGPVVWPDFSLCPYRVAMTSLFDGLHRGVRGFGHVREGQAWGWWQAPWKLCLPVSVCPLCPCRLLWIWCPRSSCSLKVCHNTNQSAQSFVFFCVYLCAYHSLSLSWLTNCMLCPLCPAVLKTPLYHVLSSSSSGAPETRPLGSADLFMLTPLCLLTGALMLTGKLTKHHLKLLNLQHCPAVWHDAGMRQHLYQANVLIWVSGWFGIF